MMVRVDETRQEDVTREVEHFIGSGGELGHGSDFFNEAAANEKTTIRKFGLVVVHGEEVGVFYQEGGHEAAGYVVSRIW